MYKLKNIDSNIIENLNINQTIIINRFIKLKFYELDTRVCNALLDFLEQDLTIKNISDKIFHKNIKNIGMKSMREIEEFLIDIHSFILKASKIEDDLELNKMLIVYFACGDDQPEIKNFLDVNYKEDSITLFGIVNMLINNVLFNTLNTLIFNNIANIYNNSEAVSLDTISNSIGLKSNRIKKRLIGFTRKICCKY